MAAHGEFKQPGGKLVVVDVNVTDGRLSGVEVTGDFFLEPAEALDAITAALEGAPATAGVDELAARVTAALPPGTMMLGFDERAVATALRRALDDGAPRERL